MEKKDFLCIMNEFITNINNNYICKLMSHEQFKIIYTKKYFNYIENKKILPIKYRCHAVVFLLQKHLNKYNIDNRIHIELLRNKDSLYLIHIILEIKLNNKSFYINYIGSTLHITKDAIYDEYNNFESLDLISINKKVLLSDIYLDILKDKRFSKIDIQNIINTMYKTKVKEKKPKLELRVCIKNFDNYFSYKITA